MSNLVNVAENFDEFVSSGVVVVDFFATWCGPCKMLAPILDELALEMPQVKFGKVDVDQSMDLARRFSIRSIPDVLIFKDGVQVDHILGLCDKEEIVDTINKYL